MFAQRTTSTSTRSCLNSSSPYRTSLPVVPEDIRDGEDWTDSESNQENLQNSLDICLSHLENLQFSPFSSDFSKDSSLLTTTSSSTTSTNYSPVDRCPSFGVVGNYVPGIISTNAETSAKSDSGFWSQSFDTYRFSMAALEDSADVDLDAILLSLNALGDELEQESLRTTTSTSTRNSSNSDFPKLQKQIFQMSASAKSVSPVAAGVPEFDLVEHYYKQTSSSTDSPDNDSAFSDNVSCISSESGASRIDGASCMSSGSSSKSSNGSLNAPSPTQRLLDNARLESISEVGEKENIPPTSATTTDAATAVSSRLSAIDRTEKIKMVHEKINEESDVKKLFVKMHFNDDLEKRFIIDERMDCLDVCQISAEKVATKMTPDCAIVEYLPELNIERFFEDHEKPFDNIVMWDRDGNHNNKLLYVERKDKYHFIARPEIYLTGFACKDSDYDELARRTLVQEYFSSFTISPPELEGLLYLRIEAKKAWKKCWFVLRASGLYYSTKAKSKSSSDLECLTSFEVVNLYRGISWKKKHKAPTDFGFALKLPQIQSAKAVKTIKYICTDDQQTLDLWMSGIRIAKYGRILYENFNRALERTATLEATESFDNSAQQTPIVSRRDAFDSTAFDDDLTTGTIKRKPPHSTPSATPKLPFTTKTSQILMRSADERRSFASQSSRSSQSSVSEAELPPPPPELLGESSPTPLSPLVSRNGPGTVGNPLGLLNSSATLSPQLGLRSSPSFRGPQGSSTPLSPQQVRSPPPPTPPKPAALLQRKPSVTDQHRHSIGPTPTSPSHNGHSAQTSQLPFLHELRTKSQSPLVTKKVLACVPETHDILSQPSSPARKAVNITTTTVASSPTGMTSLQNGYQRTLSPSSPARRMSSIPSPVPPTAVTSSPVNGYQRTQSMSPMLNGRNPPPPPRRSDMTKLGDGDVQRRSEGIYLERSVSESGQPSQRALSSTANFMADLTRVLAQKKRHSLLLTDSAVPADGTDYLPPPPPELLKGFSPTPVDDSHAARRRPPPPPKRSDGTYLTRGGK